MPTAAETRLLAAVATLTDEVSDLKHVVDTMSKDVAATKELVEAWTTVKTVGRFIKWISGILTAIAATWLLLKIGVLHLIGGRP